MKEPTIEKLTGAELISTSGDYVALYWRGFYLFTTDGKFLYQRTDLRYIAKVLFLPDDRILLDVGKPRKYMILRLSTGEELYSFDRPQYDYSGNHFLITPDKTIVVDMIYRTRSSAKPYIVTIDLCRQELNWYHCKSGWRVCQDMIFDENETLCLLESQIENLEDNTIELCGIRYDPIDGYSPGSSNRWKYMWGRENAKTLLCFFLDAHTILTRDLYLFKPKTSQYTYLLENSPDWKWPETVSLSYHFSQDQKYLILYFSTCNVVVDIAQRKVVAQYAAKDTFGCIVGREFWLPAKNGVIRKPFPLMEEPLPYATPSLDFLSER